MSASVNSYKFTIQPGGTYTLARQGNVFACITATGDFDIQIDHGQAVSWGAGRKILTEGLFNEVAMINPSGVPLVGEVLIAKGDFDPGVTLSGEVQARPVTASAMATPADVVCPVGQTTLVFAASGTRREALLTNMSPEAVRIVGAPGDGAGVGLPLNPTATATLETSAAVYVRNDGAIDVTIACLEIGDA